MVRHHREVAASSRSRRRRGISPSRDHVVAFCSVVVGAVRPCTVQLPWKLDECVPGRAAAIPGLY